MKKSTSMIDDDVDVEVNQIERDFYFNFRLN